MNLKSLLKGFLLSSILLFYTGLFSQIQASSDVTGIWSFSSNFSLSLASSALFNFNNKLFFVGGANSVDYSNVWMSSSNLGVLSNWLSVGNLPQTKYWSASVSKAENAYLLGGASLANPSTYLNTVLLGKLDVLGDLTVWTVQNPLPNNLGLGAAAISGNRIFFSGGFNNVVVSKKVYSAPINPDGSLGVWIEAGEMPEGRIGHGMIEHNGNLIILGGSSNGPALTTVYKSSINPDGTISSWTSLPSLPDGAYRGSFVKAGGQILVLGGAGSSGSKDTVYYSSLHDDGTIDPWTLSSNHIPNTVHGAAATVLGNYLYLIGGYRTQTDQYLDSVYFTKLNLNDDIILNVPLIKQSDPQWANLEYDTAHLWASPSAITVKRWGCALTSAVMVLRYNGITKMPDGTDLNPDSLNTWLKNQKDGYVYTGWVNWEKLADFSKKAKPQNPNFNFDSLEFKSHTGYDAELLRNDLKNNTPEILQVPSHFIVATGTHGDTFTINDPLFNRNFLTDYSSTFSAQKRFIPSHSDLSYIILFTLDGIGITVKDALGNVVGEYTSEQQIADSESGSLNNPQPLRAYYVQQPEDGKYTITISSNAPIQYNVGFYLYDLNANVKIFEKKDVLSQNDSDTFSVDFNKNGNDNAILQQSVTFTTLKNDLNGLYSLGFIKKDFYKDIKEEIAEIEKNYGRGKNVIKKLKDLIKDMMEEKKLNSYALSILINDLQILINTL